MARTILFVEHYTAADESSDVRPVLLFDFDTLLSGIAASIDQELPHRPNRIGKVLDWADGLMERIRRPQKQVHAPNNEWSPQAFISFLRSRTDEQVVVDGRICPLAWIFDRSIGGPSSLQLKVTTPIPYIEAYCRECSAAYDSSALKADYWGYDHGPLASGGGRKLLCPENHAVLSVQDWIS